jgi:hypothetical protein
MQVRKPTEEIVKKNDNRPWSYPVAASPSGRLCCEFFGGKAVTIQSCIHEALIIERLALSQPRSAISAFAPKRGIDNLEPTI